MTRAPPLYGNSAFNNSSASAALSSIAEIARERARTSPARTRSTQVVVAVAKQTSLLAAPNLFVRGLYRCRSCAHKILHYRFALQIRRQHALRQDEIVELLLIKAIGHKFFDVCT